MSYEDTAPAADKFLHADGSVTTMAGEVILPADQNRAKEYENMSPQVAKWLQSDGSVVDGLPTSGEGITFTSAATVPESSVGKLGDFCITPEGFYTKKMVQSVGGFMLSGVNTDFNGMWHDMGINDVSGSYGGDPQGTHYYKHEDGLYLLYWNSAYGGYWWIGTALSQDNGSATAYCSTPTYIEPPPNDGWSGSISGALAWIATVPDAEPSPKWVRCFEFRENEGLPYFGSNRLMKYADSILNVYSSNGLSLSLYADSTIGGKALNAYLNLAGSGNMARIDSYNQLFVGESAFLICNPTGAAQTLYIDSYRNFRVHLSAENITFSFLGSVSTGNYPCTITLWLIPKASIAGIPKHTVTWPSNVYWTGDEAHKFIGKTGQPDTPVLAELTTFDNGSTWIGRAFNVLYPEQEV